LSVRILIIESNTTDLAQMAALLHAAGHAVSAASDVRGAVRLALREHPDLILCALARWQDGEAAIAALRAEAALASVPLLALTAQEQVGAQHARLLDAGFDGYLGKPVAPEFFASQIAGFLPQRAPQQAEPGQAKILIVDDHVLNRQFLLTLLGYGGYHLLEAANGVEALAIVRSERPDVVISDILMPNMDGREFVVRLRADPSTASIPVIFYTATYREREANRIAFDCGVRWVLAKPSDPELILRTVHEALGLAEPEPALTAAATDAIERRGFAMDGTVAQYFAPSGGGHDGPPAAPTTLAPAQGAGTGGEPGNGADSHQMTERLASSLSSLQAVSLRLTALIELGIELGAERDPQALLEVSCRVAQNICLSQYACAGVIDEGGNTLAYFAAYGLPPGALPHDTDPRCGPLGDLLREGRPLRFGQLSGEPQAIGMPAGHAPIHSFLGVPVASRERVHGWLYLGEKIGADEFSEVDERVAVTVAAQMAVAYENLQLYDEIKRHHAQLTADMTARIRLDEDLRRFRAAMDATADAIFLIDRASACYVDVNITACHMLGYEREDFLGAQMRPGDAPTRLHDLYNKLLAGDQSGAMAELLVQRKDGSSLSVEVQRRTLRSGATWILVAVVRDISERKEAEQRLLKLAHFDTLTGLPNRSQFYDALGRALEQAGEHKWAVGVLFLDIDRFKTVNDTLGHPVGDELLRQFSSRLVDCLRVRDTIGRFGGDEFAAILLLPEGAQTAVVVVDKIREALRRPFDLKGHEVTVTASIGITIFPDDSLDADTLIQYADTAMYRAKEAGRDAFRFFTAEMNAQSLARLDLENALRHAIENEEFVLYFQPKVHIGSGRISGAEALIRWQRPGHGMVSPQLFVPILEDAGLIVPVGAWVLDQACRQIRAWSDSAVGKVQLSVNVSGIQFFVGGLENEVRNALTKHDIAPELLELELTESCLMSNAEETITVLRNLKALGIKVSVDDFGTGYSSLAYLKRFPIDKLKIDIAFVREVTSNPDDAAIVLAIIHMAHSLKLQVIAEGVEREAQLAYLHRHGCDEMQGYYFSRPVPAEEFAAMLREGRRLATPSDGVMTPQQTLLIVDDDAFMLDVLADFLAQDGYRILTAQTAAEGFDLLARNKVQVILCDQCMPMMSGTEFMERVKHLCPDTFRIMLSAYADLTPIMAAINHGAIDRFYTKPWKGAVLRENIREGFRLHAQAHGGAHGNGHGI
jgi:diguanylate cyclase (GGDEF)-like protein/PAS domain S-box-containing protein